MMIRPPSCSGWFDLTDNDVNESFQNQLASFEEYIARGSGCTLSQAIRMEVHTAQYRLGISFVNCKGHRNWPRYGVSWDICATLSGANKYLILIRLNSTHRWDGIAYLNLQVEFIRETNDGETDKSELYFKRKTYTLLSKEDLTDNDVNEFFQNL
jgi:hypothetical protein